jgi:hypothetical protein
MTEKELIQEIKKLKQIKPEKEWVVLTKRQILGSDQKSGIFEIFSPIFKPAFASVVTLGLLMGIFVFAQNALPGEPLYPLKKITERAQAFFVAPKDQPKLELEFTEKRVEELNQIVQKNEVKKLASAVKEVKESISQTTKMLITPQKIDKEIVEKTKKIRENIENTEKVLATQILTEKEKEAIYKIEVEYLIEDLEKRTLSPEDQEIFEKAKADYKEGNYSEALTKILILSQNKE